MKTRFVDMTAVIKEKAPALTILSFGLLVAAVVVQAQTSVKVNASVRLERDKSSGFFTLTVSDPDGIQEFSLLPPKKSPYGGGVKCPTTFKNNNVIFGLEDFEPKMDAVVTDCKGNVANLELPPLKDGVSRSIVPKPVEESVTTPTPTLVPTPAPAPAEKPKAALLANIQFPVKELGDCQSEIECLTYCDNPTHGKECLAFAKKNNLLSSDEVKKIENLVSITDGPGGCNSQKSCEAYCNNVSRINECVEFAEKHGFLSGRELEEAKKIRDAVKSGVKMPGNCSTKAECEAYCNDTAHAEECIAFGEQSGFMGPRELELYRKFLELQKRGETPGGCSSRGACELYCQNPDNMEECLIFGEKTGFIPKEELEMARKVIPLMKEGKMPGGCRSKEQCEAYCADESRIEECVNFGIQIGMVSAEEAEMIKKTGGKGPGGCRGREQCDTYCQENQEACMSWAQEQGMIKEEDLMRMREGMQKFREDVQKFPPEMMECLKDAVGEDNFMKMQEGQPVFDRGLEKKMQACFEIMSRDLGIEIGPGGSFKGPGGCTSQEECMSYCQANQADPACQQMMQGFGAPGGAPPGGAGGFPGGGPEGGFPGGIPSGEKHVGPGGCRTPEECIRYCKQPGNEEECNAFQTPVGTPYAKGRGPGGCASVEECREYCHAHGAECDAFVAESVPPEGKCQAGYQIERDALGYKYCNPSSCPEGQAFHTDVFGRRACSPVGIPGGPGGIPGASGGFPGGQPAAPFTPEQIQQQLQQQIQQQYQQQLPQQQIAPPSSAELNARVFLKPLIQYGEDKYSIVVEDTDGVKEFSVTGVGGQGLYGGGYNTARPCNDGENLSRPSSTVTIPVSYFPLHSTVTDCKGNTTTHTLTSSGAATPISTPSSGGSSGQYQVDCSLFVSAPSCFYAGEVGSQNYNYCKQCFPDK